MFDDPALLEIVRARGCRGRTHWDELQHQHR
jgi:hypothetical protein